MVDNSGEIYIISKVGQLPPSKHTILNQHSINVDSTFNTLKHRRYSVDSTLCIMALNHRLFNANSTLCALCDV